MAGTTQPATLGTGLRRRSPDSVHSWGLRRGDALGSERRVVRRIAVGRKTEVYLAWDERRRTTVIAKTLRPDRVATKFEKLRREAELLERLSHPVLVRGYDASLDSNPPHLVLEHLEGPSLRQVMRDGPVPYPLVASVGLQVSSLLRYLAGEGLVHLDVKPHNILFAPGAPVQMLEPAGEGRPAQAPDGPSAAVKLIDVAGIQVVGDRTTGLGAAIPEHDSKTSTVGTPAGVWLLGTTMWRALVGRTEGRFGGPRPSELLTATRFPGDVPEAMAEVVSACVQDDPSRRPSPEQVAVVLEPFTEGVVGPVRVPRTHRRSWLARAIGIQRALSCARPPT